VDYSANLLTSNTVFFNFCQYPWAWGWAWGMGLGMELASLAIDDSPRSPNNLDLDLPYL
jgi:hypothetical protein